MAGCRRSWKFTSDLFPLDLNPSSKILFRVRWMGLWKLAQIANVGIMRDALQSIFQLHDAFSTTTLCHPASNEHINCYDDSCDLSAPSTWFLLSRSQDTSICRRWASPQISTMSLSGFTRCKISLNKSIQNF